LRKLDFGFKIDTLYLRALEINGNNMGDARMLHDLLTHIPELFVTAPVNGEVASEALRRGMAALAPKNAHAIIQLCKKNNP